MISHFSKILMRGLPSISLIVVLGLIMFPIFAKPLELATEDYGRHLVNGREILRGNFSVLYANTYSFESGSYRFVNHHWLFGVIVYLAEQAIGIVGIQIVFFIMVVVAGAIMLRSYFPAHHQHGLWITAIPLSFLLASRSTVRPEGFGLLFLSLFLALLHRANNKQLTKKIVIALVLIQILWANIHISFVFGIGAVFVYGLFQARERSLQYFKLTFLLAIASCVNPNGIVGALMPLTIFQDYGYSIVENQNLFFLASLNKNAFIGAYWAYVVLVIGAAWVGWKSIPLHAKLLALIGLVLGWSALRNLPIAGLLCIPLLAEGLPLLNVTPLIRKKYEQFLGKETVFLVIIVVYLLVLFGVYTGQLITNRFSLMWKLDYGKNQFGAVEFLKSLPIRGNMFNNYDIGSYLIGSLYPEHKVFVDNRPEAYGKDFFEKLYIPLHIDEELWKEFVEEKNIHVIVFGYTDITPWAREFMRARVTDPAWIAIHLDERAIIWIKNVPEYSEIAQKFRISEQKLHQFCLDLHLGCSTDLR